MPYNNNNNQGQGGRGWGRGRGQFRGQGRGGQNSQKQQQDLKFAPQNANKLQTATYTTIKDNIIQYIQKTYKDGHDVAISLCNMQKKDLMNDKPTREQSTVTNAAVKKIKQDGFDIKYQAQLSNWMERCKTLDMGLIKVYLLIFMNYCTRVMQSRIEEHPDFESNIRDDPIRLLEAIKTLQHNPVWAHYPFASITEAIAWVVNFRQAENENLLDYVKHFKQHCNVLKSHIRKKIFDEFIENTEDYHALSGVATTEQQMKNDAYKQWSTYLLIQNSDQSKYGMLVKGLISQFSMGNNQYPKTITAATDVLSNHHFDKCNNQGKDNKQQNKSQQQSTNDNDNEGATKTSFAQNNNNNATCYCCRKKGHLSTECDKKNSIAQDEWYIHRALNNMQDGDEMEDDDVSELDKDDDNQSTTSAWSTTTTYSRMTSRNCGHRSGWSGLQFKQTSKTINLENILLLDTGSTMPATIMNPDFV